MTKQIFYMPYTGGDDYDDDFRNFDSSLFSAIRFINSNKNGFYKGFVPFSGGQPYGQIGRTHFTSVDVENAGAVDINDIILMHMVSHSNLQQRAYACVRHPVSVSSQNMQAGVITVEVWRDQLRLRHWTASTTNILIQTATSARLAAVSGGVRISEEPDSVFAKSRTAVSVTPGHAGPVGRCTAVMHPGR